ncbi:MAG: glutamate--tRNA ligase, partial [Synergistaceae bacterium]|nr:glutamate--tRNA ligase [Synergistaceae bacterium]
KYLADALTLMAGRGRTAKEMAEFSDYFVSFEPVKARWNAEGLDKEKLKEFFAALFASPEWKAEALENIAREFITSHEGSKMKDYAMPFRFALTGMKVSPGIFEVAELMGKEECEKRVKYFF